jgi:hypothetical protein
LVLLLIVGCGSSTAQHIVNNGIAVVNTGLVYTNGDWQNSGPFRNDGEVITTDNWLHTGTIDNASTGGFVLRYTADKTFSAGSGSSFGYLTKEGAGVATFVDSFTLRDSLRLSVGILRSPSASITLATGARLTNLAASHVDGVLIRRGTGTLVFPVGRDGLYLPITFQSVTGTNPATSVRVQAAPGGFTAGVGVSTLNGFPYAWVVTKSNPSDSAGFVEVEYPDALPNATDGILMRKVTGANRYEGMGARQQTIANGRVRLRSYSRGLQGLFSVGRGFRGNLRTDSLALVALYQQTAGAAWTNRTNWLTGRVGTWQGITETGGQITAVNLANNRLTGPVPDAFADMAALHSVNLSGNQITKFPNLTTSTGLAGLNLSNNRLGFGSLLPNVGITGINYAGQANIDADLQARPEVGTDFKVKAITDGTGNQFVWRRNGIVVPNATDSTYTIVAINRSNMGDYVAEITNPGVPNLTLRTGTKNVLAVANITGTVQSTATAPMNNGVMRLFKVTTVGAYDTIRVQNTIAPDGRYAFNAVVLDDYTVLAAPNATAFPNDLPTYYTNKLFWEEADKIQLTASRNDINITMAKKPTTAPVGQGVIGGFFEEPIGGGREDGVSNNRRVSNASVSVRRRVGTGRTTNERLELVAQLTTNQNGEFEFTSLPEGEYLLNLQYPGFPMDERSFINIQIGKGLNRRVSVEALVQADKIVVNKRVVTGWEEDAENLFTVYPNPTKALIHVEINNTSTAAAGALQFVILNAQGQRVRTGVLPADGLKNYDLTELATGVYVMQISQHGQLLSTQRLVVME